MRALLILALSLTAAFAQKVERVGKIEFFGYSGVDLKKLKAGLPIKEGQDFVMEKPGDPAKLTIRTKEAAMFLAAITGDGTEGKRLAFLRRSDVRERLSEMSRWPKGHCETAQRLLKVSGD